MFFTMVKQWYYIAIWPWTWVGKLTCCLGSKHVRISLNLLACPFELSRCKLKSPIYTNCHGVDLVLYSKSWNSSKIDIHVPFLSLYRQTTKPLNELFPIRAEIASNVLNDGRGWISVFNWSDISMPTPRPVRWSARASWKNEQGVRYQLSMIALYHVLTLFLSLPQCPYFSMLHIRRRGLFSVW